MKSSERVDHWKEFLHSVNESSSTLDSKHNPREIILQTKGKMYELHKQKLKQQYENEQILLSPFKPCIISDFESHQKVENRLTQFGKASAARLEKKRKEKLENSKVSLLKCKKRPENPEFPDRMLNFQKIYEKNIEEKKIQKLEDEAKQLKNPKICKKSEEIVKTLNRIENVEERLIYSSKKQEEKVEMRKILENVSSKLNSVPQITDFAKNLKRQGNVSERLLRYKDYYEENLKNLSSKYHPETTHSTSRSNSVARERLLKPKSASVSPTQHSYRPTLSQNSLKIAEKLEKSASRLLKTPNTCKSAYEEPDCFFKPSINKHSEKIDNRKNTSAHRWEALYNLKDYHEEKIKEISESLNKNDPECTFKPMIKVSRQNPNPMKFAERVSGWKKGIDEKISNIRENFIREDDKKCTFTPDISPLKLKTQSPKQYSKEITGYSKKYKQVTADEFLNAVQQLHKQLHQDV